MTHGGEALGARDNAAADARLQPARTASSQLAHAAAAFGPIAQRAGHGRTRITGVLACHTRACMGLFGARAVHTLRSGSSTVRTSSVAPRRSPCGRVCHRGVAHGRVASPPVTLSYHHTDGCPLARRFNSAPLHPHMPTIDDRATIDIETSGGTVPLETHGNETISVHIRGDGAVDYVVDVNDHLDNDWIEDVKSGLLTGSTDYDETFVTGAAFVRIRATTGTGVAGNSATVYLASGGT